MGNPWSIQIELTLGCNRRCDFCYTQVLEQNQPEFMTISTAHKAAHEIQVFNPTRLKFAMRGEPLLNPDWPQIIRIFREHLPGSKILLTTNGDYLTPSIVQRYYDCGGNTLLIDCYDNNLHIREKQYTDFNPIIFDDNQHTPWDKINPYTHELFLVPNIREHHTPTRKLSNLAGNMTPHAQEKYHLQLTTPLSLPCTRPFGELTITHDGKVGWCCLDGTATNSLWHINHGKLEWYWNHSPRLNWIRQRLQRGNRQIPLCRDCSFFGGEQIRLPNTTKGL